MQTPIHDFLREYADADHERCHTPGHKGRANPFDLTEVNAEAIDVITQSERNAARLFAAGRTFFSCSGATLGIFAMLAPFAGKRVAAFRDNHRSFIDAAIALDVEVVWCYKLIQLKKAESAAVFVTNIDYYGNVADVSKIVQFVNCPVLVDNAHGAYLVFTQSPDPIHPMKLGAAMCTDSAHKTLPVLTGGAYVHIAADYMNDYGKTVADAMALFGTTSPSYLILESLDLCNVHIAQESEQARKTFPLITHLKERLRKRGYIVSYCEDILRVVVECTFYGYSGHDFAEELFKRGIVCEMQDAECVILMFSTITEQSAVERVYEAFCDIEPKEQFWVSELELSKPRRVLSMREAYFADKKTLPLSESAGEVCAGVHVTVPPCVPLIMPGEIIESDVMTALVRAGLREIDVVIPPCR
ncbi:MAG: hypothetical protein FWG45_06225 [Oscillospiraceae bacterium]|nr:hypothetical protein [Oscillospiraceae bacterium]